jgi:hypothetical protein
MGSEDVSRALGALADDDVRGRVADGDAGALGDLALSDEERDLVRGAAEDYPEVEAFFTLREQALPGGYVSWATVKASPTALTQQAPKFAKALNYVGPQG